MSNKRAENAGKLIGGAAALAILAATIAAAILPFFLAFAYLNYWWKARQLRKEFPEGREVAWLTENEREKFKRIYPDYLSLQELVMVAEKRSENSRLPRNKDGSLDLRNKENKGITADLNRARSMLDDLENKVYNLQYRIYNQWEELNEMLKKRTQVGMAILGWAVGAAFYYARSRAGAPFTVWFELFIPALCAGGGALLAMLVSRNPACLYTPRPQSVDMENVDSPEIQLPMRRRNRFWPIVGASVWALLLIVAFQKGNEQGVVDAAHHRERVAEVKALNAERERQIQETWDLGHTSSDPISDDSNEQQTGGGAHPERKVSGIGAFLITAHFSSIPDYTLSRLDSGQVEEIILAIYAHYGAEFESESAQKWAEQQPWYQKIPGKTINDAEKEFDVIAQNNVKQLVTRWNEIQVEEGLAPVPVEESPLAGRGISSDLEKEGETTSAAVLKALPVGETPSIIQGNLNAQEVGQWDLARVRYEINTIYARHGVVFPKREIQAYFEVKEWYQPVPGRGFEEAEQLFSPADKIDIELLAARRLAITENP